MASLYVANISKQHHTFTYRAPESNAIRNHNIPPGNQVLIEKPTLEAPEIDYILKQYAIYGIASEAEIKRRKGFVGLCYSIGKPVNIDSFFTAYEHNDDVLQTENDDRLSRSTAAISDRLGRVSDQTPLTHTAVEIVEEGATATFAKGVEVVAESNAPRNRAERRAKRK